MEWIRIADISRFDIFKAFDELHVIDWTRGPYKVKEGDVVFFYVSAPYSKIMIKTRCIKDDVNASQVIDDREYWTNKNEFDESKEYIRLKLISKVDNDKLSISKLNELKLIRGGIRGAIKNTGRNELFNYINAIFNELKEGQIKEDINDTSILSETEKQQNIKGRIGQGEFRNNLLELHSGKCMICGLGIKELLIASHIKEWSDASNSERLDNDNGLLLCALHDSLFDQHLISFSDDGNILISKQLSQSDVKLLNLNNKDHISLTEGMKGYMKYHREKFNKKSNS